MDNQNLNRRQFFRQSLTNILEIFEKKEEQETEHHQKKTKIVRPPGAKQEDEFLKLCDGCNKCVEACPYEAIHLLQVENKSTAALQLEKSPCRWCPDMPCIKSCPSGALTFPEKGNISPIAKAQINISQCLNSQGILCDECAMFCPPNVRAIKIQEKKPQLDIEKCVGCGLCAFYCQATPTAIDMV